MMSLMNTSRRALIGSLSAATLLVVTSFPIR